MMDLVACPVCTLYLHKGMSLAEHLETHPKEQVIKALVSLATGSLSSGDILTNNVTNKTTTPVAPSTATSSANYENFQSANTVLHSSNNLQIRSPSNGNSSSPSSSLNNFTTSSNFSSNIQTTPVISTSFNDVASSRVHSNASSLNYKSNSAYSSGYQVQETHGLQANSNMGNQSSSINFPSHLQHLFNSKTKQLPPPPEYRQAISQLRSQNFARTNTTKSLANLSLNSNNNSNNCNAINTNFNNSNNNSNDNSYQISSNSSTSYSIVNQQTTNFYTNTNNYQETLDFSLPKQHHQSSTVNNSSLPAPPYNSSSHLKRGQNSDISTSNGPCFEFSTYSQPLDCQTTLNEEVVKFPKGVNLEKEVNNPRSPSPICLITSIRSSENSLNESHQASKSQSHSSSVLRFADTPPAAQYIERDSGDFLVQESPRHIVECIEKDNGEFSVIEKVIQSPPSIVSVNEHILEENAQMNNEKQEADDDIHEEVSEEHGCDDKNNELSKNNKSAKFSENDIKTESSENFENENADLIEHKNESKNNEGNEQRLNSSKRKLISKGVKVLSNVKLDANKSLEIVENIQKCSTEEFWTGIVNTIKKEDSDKSYSCNSLPSTSASSEVDEVEELNNLNDKKTAQKCTSTNLSVENATKIIATSVIRLAVNQKQLESKIPSSSKKSKSPKREKDLNEKSQIENEPIASCSSQSRLQNSCVKKNVYRKNPKKLIVKFKNPLPPVTPSPISFVKEGESQEIIDITENESIENDSVKPEDSILIPSINKGMKQKNIDDSDETTLNNMMEQIVNEDDISFGAPGLENEVNTCETVEKNLTENFNLKIEKEPDFADIGKPMQIQDATKIPSASPSTSSLGLSSSYSSPSSSSPLSVSNQEIGSLNDLKIIQNDEFCDEDKNFMSIKTNNCSVENESRNVNEKKSDLSFTTSNITKTVFIIEEIDDDRQCDRKVAVQQTNQIPGQFLNNEFQTVSCGLSTGKTPESFTSDHQPNKQQIQQQIEHAELVIDIQNNQSNTQQNTYCDYPFSFLYSASSTVIPNTANLNFSSGAFTSGATTNQNNNSEHEIIFNSNSSSNSNMIDKTTNSLTSASSSISVYSKTGVNDDNAVNGGIQIFNRYVGPTIFTSREDNESEEKNSYLDLDLCTKHTENNDGETRNNGSSTANGILNINTVTSISTHNSRDNLITELNIRTDEKMPAKGEISEQESNGDIDNSWSQPIYNELTYKYSNPYDVSHESWSLSHDEFFNPHDLNNIRSKVTTNSDIEKDIKPILPGTSTECVNEPAGSKKIKKRKKAPTLFSATTTILDTVNLNNNAASSSLENGQISGAIITKKKAYQCDHCSVVFVRLKDRNHHMVSIHQYKRVNRRLIREAPSSTVTSATINNIVSITDQQSDNVNLAVDNDTKPDVNDSVTSLVLSSQYIKTENEFPEASQPIIETTVVSTTRNDDIDIPDGDDKKPDLAVVATRTTVPANYPRTKYDSIRTNVYRLLMNFNLGVLKQNSNVEIDQNLFNSKSFCCMVCKQDFISVKLFDEHLSEHPAECFTCGKKFSRWTYFSIHLKRHLGWKDFGCTICQKKFVIRSALVEHMRIHTGITPLNCNLCSKSFKRYSNLTQHKRVCHTKKSIRKKDYVCYCGEVLPTKARFIWHKETHDPKPKCCLWCCDRFIHVNSLRRHIRLAHADKFAYNEPAECPICNNIYAKTSLKSHMATHSMETQHECAICNKSFSTKWNLKIHSWVHANRTAKPFKCEHCTKAFVREIDYKNHMNAHKQIRPYTCEYCGCKFIRKYNYLRHRREHHGQKKFSCDLCGKLFHRHYYLIEHRRIHTGERPFLCTICGKSSTTKTNHNKHLKIHHSRDPFTSEA
ncbi:protein PF3D7_1417600 [Condylostylus longicornis]|uniref:protein PF3D7_1417600 n=1 Tax=Condylostylus longicornis TaxID=2530218 RepID=UPI00244DCCCD|nr:protein PF3D7_1417600 [Condylostylus longicornis]